MGVFNDRVESVWLPDGRTMQLTKELTYTDSYGFKWIAPKFAKVDGASIPRFFWRIIGGPLTGKYRRASVIHDTYCKNKNIPHKHVHKMFREAMLSDGVIPAKANLMYCAVKWFGPKWK